MELELEDLVREAVILLVDDSDVITIKKEDIREYAFKMEILFSISTEQIDCCLESKIIRYLEKNNATLNELINEITKYEIENPEFQTPLTVDGVNELMESFLDSLDK